MNYEMPPTSSVCKYAKDILHNVGKGVIAMGWVLLVSGVLLIGSACDRSSAGSPPAAGATVDQNPPAGLPLAPSTNPSSIQYVSSNDPGQAAVSGTSTLHDWTVKSTILQGHAELSGKWKGDSAGAIVFQSIDLVIPGDSLKSTEGSGMDKTMYDALKLNQFPNITYKLTKASLKTPSPAQGSAYHFDATGQLTVGGATHPVDLDLATVPHDDGLTITTDIALKMTDFGIKPPTAMMGMIKSGDAITVKVSWQLTMRSPTATVEK